MGKLKAQITTWYPATNGERWGFATTATGKIFFVDQAAFRDHRQSAHLGSIIEFDEPVTQTAAQAFVEKLNSGQFRDDTRSGRNPKRGAPGKPKPRAKPRAVNVVVIDGGTDGQV